MVSSPRETRFYFGCAFLFAATIRPIGESVRAPTVRFDDSSAIAREMTAAVAVVADGLTAVALANDHVESAAFGD
ncbi:hypothetical protein NJ7G_0624 [Natrinema sp. J7-2]|nr:hypothetical protein NJ7G_0624 [Natrinema sp. J7-2]